MEDTNKKDLETLKKYCKKKAILKAHVVELLPFDYNGTKRFGVRVVFSLNKRTKIGLIKPSNISIGYNKNKIKDLLDQDIDIVITKVKDSRKVYAKLNDLMVIEDIRPKKIEYDNDKKSEMLKNFENFNNKEFDVKISEIMDWGANVVDKNNVKYFMYNSGFAKGYIPINKVKKIGDKLKVKIIKCDKIKEIIYVAMVEKYEEEITKNVDEFKVDEVIKGTIVTKTSTLCFVNIAPMIDALCSPIEGLEVGTDVFVQISAIKELKNRKTIRGKIILTKFDDELKL